jgi:integrase
MAHYPKPFFRAPRGVWYVQIDGKQHNLGPDKVEAFKTYHGLMRQRAEAPTAVPLTCSRLVAVIVDEFLDWTEKHRASDTHYWYKERLQRFLDAVPPDLTVEQFKPFHVQKWIDGYPKLSSGSKRNYCRSIMRAMKWAEEQGLVERSPLAHFRKPPGGHKELVVTPDQFKALLDRYDDQEFQDLLTVTWETGCRPQESLRVEARHVDLAGSRWVFPASESKGKKIPRVVYLTPKALEISKRLILKHPSGPIFRNMDGKPWNPYATNCRFQTVRRKTGVKYSLYALRHSFATNALIKGVDCITVATLLGHAEAAVVVPLTEGVHRGVAQFRLRHQPTARTNPPQKERRRQEKLSRRPHCRGAQRPISQVRRADRSA